MKVTFIILESKKLKKVNYSNREKYIHQMVRRGAVGQGGLWEAVESCEEPQRVARDLEEQTAITGQYLLARGPQFSQ
jgi:hypothetical protein